ncbi:hypothetical protein UlMin_024648 [Ulmus minor]
MSDSREDSPDWLHCFQAPTGSAVVLSSDSEPSPDRSPLKVEDRNDFEERSIGKSFEIVDEEEIPDKFPDTSGGESPSRKRSKLKSPKKGTKVEDHNSPEKNKSVNPKRRKGNGGDAEVMEEEASDKHIEPKVSSSMLPLMLSDKVHRTKALVECEGDSIDLSGDMGAVGRVMISNSTSENHDLLLDLKGTIYKTTIVPSRTFCVVSFGQSEAKIEAIMNDFIQLKPQANVFEAETMVEGTLDGFSFDSDEEAEKIPKGVSHQADDGEDVEGQTNGKTKGKAAKTSGVKRKRGGGKPQPPKKAKRKGQVSKKGKTKK